MGFVKDIGPTIDPGLSGVFGDSSMLPGGESDPFFGGAQSAAAADAAEAQGKIALRQLQAQKEALETIRGDLAPFRETGAGALPDLRSAIDDPSARVLQNPFFQALASDQEQRLLASQAARGKVGSGETGDQLTRNLLLLGNQFAQQDVTNLQNLATIGANAAAQTGSQTQQAASATTGILGGLGNAQSAGIIGAGNAQAQGGQNALALGGALLAAFCDERLKENVSPVRVDDDGLMIYEFNYIGETDRFRGKMAQDIIEIDPDNVIESSDGYLMVTSKYHPERVS